MRKKVLVLGGRGFIGRHAVKAIQSLGAQVVIGTRNPRANADPPEIETPLHKLNDDSNWLKQLSDFDVVLNSVGILRQRPGETYETVHHFAPAAIAKRCKEANVRFVHVSALGLRPDARSRFNASKYRGELAIRENNGDYMIARFSLLDGEGGYGAAWLRGVSRLPVFVVPKSAEGRIAALTADNAGEALAKLCLDDQAGKPRTLEFGGETHFSFEDYIRGLRRRHSQTKAVAIRLPGWLTRFAAHVFDVFHFSPFSFGHWEMLCHDNIPRSQDLRSVLGSPPSKVIR